MPNLSRRSTVIEQREDGGCWCDDKTEPTCNVECARIHAVEDFATFLRRVAEQTPGTMLEVEAKQLLFLHGYEEAR